MHAYAADLSSLNQTKGLAQQIQRDHPSFDILLNNAGAAFPSTLSRPLLLKRKLAGFFPAHHLSSFSSCRETTTGCIGECLHDTECMVMLESLHAGVFADMVTA